MAAPRKQAAPASAAFTTHAWADVTVKVICWCLPDDGLQSRTRSGCSSQRKPTHTSQLTPLRQPSPRPTWIPLTAACRLVFRQSWPVKP